MTDNENSKPNAPQGSVEPPIMRLEASRQPDRIATEKQASIRNREITENSKQRDTARREKREE